MSNTITLPVTGCTKCGGDHEITFKELLDSVDGFTHIGMCIISNRNVLMKFEVI